MPIPLLVAFGAGIIVTRLVENVIFNLIPGPIWVTIGPETAYRDLPAGIVKPVDGTKFWFDLRTRRLLRLTRDQGSYRGKDPKSGNEQSYRLVATGGSRRLISIPTGSI